MTNVFGTAEKVGRRTRLFAIGVEALQTDGWKVSKIPGAGKSSVRRITKGKKSLVVSIRTTQDTYIAFARSKDDSEWVTLSTVDAVVAVSVDDANEPRFAQVHMIDGADMRDRFDRAYAARLAAGHTIPVGRGVWLPLYLPDAKEPAAHVGGGAGLDNPAIARVPLEAELEADDIASNAPADCSEFEPLTIAEAKRRLALSLGVEPSSIKITI